MSNSLFLESYSWSSESAHFQSISLPSKPTVEKDSTNPLDLNRYGAICIMQFEWWSLPVDRELCQCHSRTLHSKWQVAMDKINCRLYRFQKSEAMDVGTEPVTRTEYSLQQIFLRDSARLISYNSQPQKTNRQLP